MNTVPNYPFVSFRWAVLPSSSRNTKSLLGWACLWAVSTIHGPLCSIKWEPKRGIRPRRGSGWVLLFRARVVDVVCDLLIVIAYQIGKTFSRFMNHPVFSIDRQAPKAVGEWAIGKKATDAEEYRAPMGAESERKWPMIEVWCVRKDYSRFQGDFLPLVKFSVLIIRKFRDVAHSDQVPE